MWSEYLRRIARRRLPDSSSSSSGRRCRIDVGAARRLGDGLDGVVALAGALPAHAVLGAEAGAARHERHPVGDDEGRIEADAELADQVRVLGAWSPASCWKNSRVPDLAMVPMCSITSWRDMPMPLSEMVIVRAASS